MKKYNKMKSMEDVVRVLGGLGFGCRLGQEYTASMKKYQKV